MYRSLAIAVACLLVFSSPVQARGGGGGGGGGAGGSAAGGMSAGDRMMDRSRDYSRGQDRDRLQDRDQDMDRDQDRDRVHSPDAGAAMDGDNSGLARQREMKTLEQQKELGRGSEQGQKTREEQRKKWWKFWE